MVNALEQGEPQSLQLAAHRLGVILKAYTVYFDIVLANRDGEIIANGRAATYRSQHTNHSKSKWFQSAMATATGDEFGFESVHSSSLVNGERVLVYSCKVCRGGDAKSQPIGVLGVIFNWDGLAQKIVHETPVDEAKRASTRVCIVDPAGNVLADSRDQILQAKIEWPERDALFAQKKASKRTTMGGRDVLIAHAQSPGFETYRTGWHSLIIEEL